MTSRAAPTRRGIRIGRQRPADPRKTALGRQRPVVRLRLRLAAAPPAVWTAASLLEALIRRLPLMPRPAAPACPGPHGGGRPRPKPLETALGRQTPISFTS